MPDTFLLDTIHGNAKRTGTRIIEAIQLEVETT
jgi:hypothetical protein